MTLATLPVHGIPDHVAQVLQLSLHEHGFGEWRVIILGATHESQRLVEFERRLHLPQGVQPHDRVSDDSRLVDGSLRQFSTDALAAKRGSDVEALHFANGLLQWSQGHTTNCFSGD